MDLKYATRFTLDGNSVPPNTRGYNLMLVMHIEKLRDEQWYVTSNGLVYNRLAGDWDLDYQFRQGDKAPYTATLDEAESLTRTLINELHSA